MKRAATVRRSALGRIRTCNLLIRSQSTGYRKPLTPRTLRLDPGSVAHHLPTDNRPTDPGLAALAEAWPDLPEAVQAGILAMVKACKP